jgi:hypothetical protein
MNCDRGGATHHLACDCREAEWQRRLDAALAERDSYRASAELRVGLRREFEALLGCGDTTGEEAFERGLARLRELVAAEKELAEFSEILSRHNHEWSERCELAESRAARLEAALGRIAVSHTGCDDRPQPSARERAELESDPWSGYQEPFCGACPRCIARAALGEEGKS